MLFDFLGRHLKFRGERYQIPRLEMPHKMVEKISNDLQKEKKTTHTHQVG
jgi:hypothetical protein